MRWVPAFTIVVAQITAELLTEPLVHWSMDSYNNSKLLPDFGDTERYSCDLPVSYFQPGVIGNALYSSSKKVKLIEDMWRSDCLRNPVQCHDGLTLSFWLKIQKLSADKDQAFLRTSDQSRRRPGVYIGGIRGEKLLFMVRTAEGKRFQASIELTAVTNQWSHLTMFWNSTSGVQVFVNSSLLLRNLYAESPSIQDVRSSYPSKVDFIVGDIPGPIFLLDDLWIFYHKLADDEVYSLFELGVPKEKSRSDAVTADYTIHEKLTSPRDQINTTGLNKVTETIRNSVASTGSPTNDSGASANTNFLEVTRTSATPGHSSTETARRQTPAIKDPVKKDNRVETQGPKTTTTPYTGWFYLQPWYHTILGVVFFSLLALSTWLCIIHCCVPVIENRKSSKKSSEQSMGLEPLVQNT